LTDDVIRSVYAALSPVQ